MKAEHSILQLCENLQVSPSGYYAWLKRRHQPSHRTLETQSLAREIESIHQDSRQTYGSPRILAVLRNQGRRHGRARVARLMKDRGLCGRKKGRYRVQTTDSNHDNPIAPNRLAVAPQPTGPHQIWVGDITYIQTQQGWLYLAAILDLYSRKIVGWAMGPSIDTALVLSALTMALHHRQPSGHLLFHSDQGVQYSAGLFREALDKANLTPSMSRRGNCYDNATMESFWSTLKLELVYRQNFSSHSHAQTEIFNYIETFYNPKRIHSALNHLSPADFELQTN